LTSEEFGVMRYLHDRPGKAVCRYDPMEAVWGHRNETASNVVDVVVRSLRGKLGARASVVETVRGTGICIEPKSPGGRRGIRCGFFT
jgi:DNA-binding response OmpR family regulator